MAKEPVWTRAYLKSIGAQDDQIDYQNGAVTYKGKPFQYTQPATDGKSYGTQQGLDSAYKQYQGNEALDQYKQNISKAPTPFSYDMNSIKSDPLYTSGLQSLQNDAQTATNQSLVNLGRRGIGNSQSAVTSANAQQQNMVTQANTKLAPQVIAQKYQQYLDANNQQDKQNQNLLGLANAQFGQAQQGFSNNLATNQDTRASQAQDFGQGVTKAGITGYYGDTSGVKQQMDANSAAWANATPEEQQRLHNENLRLAASIGSKYDQQTGEYSAPQGNRTMAGQAQDFSQGLQTRDQALQETQLNAQLTGKLPDGSLSYAAQQEALKNTAQYAGMYNGQPTMQKIMQDATIDNMTKDNARAAASEARAAGKEDLAVKFDAWDRTGAAPAGIPGVPEGTKLGGKLNQVKVNDVISQLNNSTFVKQSSEQVIGEDGMPTSVKRPVVYDSVGLAKSILSRGLSDADVEYAMKYFNIDEAEVKKAADEAKAKKLGNQ